MICLSKAELLEVSGYRRPSSVAKWLRQNGFTFRVGADGWPRVDRSHYHALMGSSVARTLTKSEPNVSALMEAQRNGKKTYKQTRPS